MSAPSSLPHWRGRAVPLLLCVSGRSFGGTPRWEVRGVERAPLLAQALTRSAFLWAHPSSACQALPGSPGARPGPGRFGGGRTAGCLGTWVKERRPSGKEEQDRSPASSQERLHHWGVGSWAAKGPSPQGRPSAGRLLALTLEPRSCCFSISFWKSGSWLSLRLGRERPGVSSPARSTQDCILGPEFLGVGTEGW